MRVFPVVFFGDSITAGWGVAPEHGWVPLAVSRLAAGHPGLPLVFHNAGVPGDTSRDGLARLARDVLASAPRLVVVQFGLNDCSPVGYAHTDAAQVPLPAYEEAMRRIAARCREAGARMLLLTSHPTRLGCDVFSGYEAARGRYNGVVRELALAGGIALCDIETRWNSLPESDLVRQLAPDGLHLSVEGNALYAEQVAACVEPFLAGKLFCTG